MKLYITNDEIAADLKEHVIKPVIPGKNLDKKTIFHLNPSRWFVIGGPHGDAGLTGRKIIIDTYGGWGAHGGGAFSGKDPTKVDRSGAYIVRQAARSIVASGLPRRCIVQVSYAIGVPEPLSVLVDTYGTGKIPDKEILSIVKENFDFRPGMIAISLDLKRGGNGRFLKTAAYGHFGRDGPDFTRDVVKPLKYQKPKCKIMTCMACNQQFACSSQQLENPRVFRLFSCLFCLFILFWRLCMLFPYSTSGVLSFS